MNCKFEPEMLEAYLSYEKAPDFISEIVQDHILEFEESNEIKLLEISQSISQIKSYFEQTFAQFQARIIEKVES